MIFLVLMMINTNACIKNGQSELCTYKPVYFQKGDKVTRITGEKIIANNEIWEELCK